MEPGVPFETPAESVEKNRRIQKDQHPRLTQTQVSEEDSGDEY